MIKLIIENNLTPVLVLFDGDQPDLNINPKEKKVITLLEGAVVKVHKNKIELIGVKRPN